MNKKDIIDYLHSMIGSEMLVRVRYGGILNLILRQDLKNGKTIKWNILSRQCSWRVIHNEYLVCGSEDEIEDIDNALSGLAIGEVTEIIQNGNLDFSLISNNGFRFDFYTNLTWEPQLTINNQEYAFELTQEGWIEIDKAELKNLYDKTFSVIDFYSKECTERWSNKVPKIQGTNSCETCFYFRSFGGSFYYWEYGVCSSKNSEYDGKLVSSKSGCIYHTELKDL